MKLEKLDFRWENDFLQGNQDFLEGMGNSG
jgi:hypothetical protein